ncbi:MAG TPA: transglycosylase domain-containing protein, partial [Actinomycetota bacterium]|nr:transglycosylase domain-containing protein [Actinomycetota bacterium]
WPWALAAGVVSIVGAVVAVVWMATFEIPALAPQAQSSRVLAADGRLIATLHAEQDRTVVPLDRISQHLQMAVLLSEDREFFEHRGMSYKGIVRAAFSNLAGGGIRQGGSTITQQYTRNAFPDVGMERKLTRKLKEAFLAIQLEQHLSKREIMERYLNTVYFGRGAYGVEAAARTYFKVPAAEVTPGQAAYLAGVIRAPERFQINENPGEATLLRNQVIDDLVEARALTPAEGRKAKREKLVEQFKPGASIEVESPRAGYFVEYVRQNLRSEFGLTDSQILRGGLTIHTTLDLNMQEAAEAAVRETLNRPDDPEAALVAMGPHGEVKAMVGGRDVDSVSRARGFNFAVDQANQGGGRQAGSAFKPIALAAFLTAGKSLESTYAGSSPMEITSGRCRNKDGTPWKVSNFEDASFGPLNITGATVSSVNTVYAQMMNTVVTPNKFIEIAERTGIEIPKFDAGCALALGTTDVTPMEMARAYTTFGQRGNRPDPLSIVKIVQPDGRVLAEAAPKVEPKLDRNVADSINYVLERNIRSGTGTTAKIGRPAAGKTGTTQNHANAWFAGYTPDLTAVVWMGYAPGEDGTIKEMNDVHGIKVTGGSLPATIWRKFMNQALQGTEARSFHKPVFDGVAVNYAGPDPSAATIAQANPSPSPTPGTTTSEESDESGEDLAELAEGADVVGSRGEDSGPAPPGAPSAATQRPDDDDDQEEPANPAPAPAPSKTAFDDCFPFCD